MKSGFKRTVSWNQYQSEPNTYAQNRYLNHLTNPSFQGANRLFVLSFENEDDTKSHSTHYLSKVEIANYHVMIDDKNFFDQLINSNLKTYENIRRIATGQGDDYTTGYLLDYSYFNNYYKMIAIDLNEQQVFDADPRAIQQTNFTASLDREGNAIIFLLLKKQKKLFWTFYKEL